ncbi:hypothetical protein I8J29_30225 [Paenibacillus sp. MWE-103]|uniref:YtxH domain-containing protein n=1 Tax=Paenibacillus artemisiicola TaxID=1172618 RepID=A0ABS3WJG3_9BACL|nr:MULTISPECIES: hypothetical protein [Paenibacillus]MBO7748471.1 hypothetical protein [Paenibacillus artemisiicola]SFI81154.1 hypothetical protein SAMN02799624_02305 [Paenibacillus sp. UNC496MF]
MIKSRVGLLLGGAALLLALSPEARRTVRRWAVKGTEGVLDMTDMAKSAGAAVQRRFSASAETIIPSDRGPQH